MSRSASRSQRRPTVDGSPRRSPGSDSRRSEEDHDLSEAPSGRRHSRESHRDGPDASGTARRPRGQRRKRRNRRQLKKEDRDEAARGPTRSEPQVSVGNILYFAQLQPSVAANKSFLLLPRRAAPQQGKPDDGRTHEVFVVITQHDGVTRSGNDGGL